MNSLGTGVLGVLAVLAVGDGWFALELHHGAARFNAWDNTRLSAELWVRAALVAT